MVTRESSQLHVVPQQMVEVMVRALKADSLTKEERTLQPVRWDSVTVEWPATSVLISVVFVR